MKLFLPQDMAAVALGADRVAAALMQAASARGIDLQLVRTGSRGAVWLEPLLEVQLGDTRRAWGLLRPEDAPDVLAAIADGTSHTLCIGDPEQHPWFARQTRLTFARCGIVDPLSVADYRSTGGTEGLARAVAMPDGDLIAEVKKSGLRGRGGAGFPAGIKWATVQNAPGAQKYIVCNADEGDSGTFADRMLMEGDPMCLIEGMAIAAVAVGATQGYIYVRSEYPFAVRVLRGAIEAATREGMIGPSVLGSAHAFFLEVRMGAGAYICGEETSLLESLEGKRGMVRAKPPLPAIAGLFGCPTVVNNVLTLASIPWILAHGGEAYAAYGTGRSLGTLPVQLGGNVRHGGLIEVPFGLPVGTLIDEWGEGTASGRPARAVQVGGPLGAYFPPSLFDTPLDYEAFAAAGGLLGHGGVVLFDDQVDLAAQARFAFEFCAGESCGKCTPCRIGAVRGMEVIDRIVGGIEPEKNFAVLDDLCELMTDTSLCAMGGLTPVPVMSALRHFPEDFDRPALPMAAE